MCEIRRTCERRGGNEGDVRYNKGDVRECNVRDEESAVSYKEMT